MVKTPFANTGDLNAGLIPGSGRSPGGGQSTPVFFPEESSRTKESGRLQSLGSQ